MVCVAVLAGLMLFSASSAWASPTYGPLNQTVPIPTATPTPTPVPTVTPAPTSTPEPESDESEDDASDEEFDEPIEDDGDFFDNTEEEEGVDEENADSGDATPSEDTDENAADAEADSPADEDGDAEDAPSGDESAGGDASGDAVDAAADSGPASTGLTATISVLVVNIREQPSLESVVVGTVFQDDELEVLGRSDSWWLVCCALGSDQPAWVNPDFLTPNFDDAEAESLLPIIELGSGDVSSSSGSSVQAAESEPNLELTMSLNPRYVWQDLTFTLEFVVRNVGTADVTNVVLRDELLEDITFVTANASGGGGVVKESLDNGNTLITASWDALAAGSEHTLSVQLQMDEQLEDGAVIDNLSVVGATETSGSTTSGISIGLPPMALPIFK